MTIQSSLHVCKTATVGTQMPAGAHTRPSAASHSLTHSLYKQGGIAVQQPSYHATTPRLLLALYVSGLILNVKCGHADLQILIVGQHEAVSLRFFVGVEAIFKQLLRKRKRPFFL